MEEFEPSKEPATTKRKKTGGRRKGSHNRDKRELLAMIMDAGCPHPIQGLAEVAVIAKKAKRYDLAANCYKELAQYVAPKRRAIEHTTEKGEAQPLVIVMPSKSEIEEHRKTHIEAREEKAVETSYKDVSEGVVVDGRD